METREHSYTVGRNVNWCSYYGEQYAVSLKTKTKVIRSCNPTPGYIPREKHDYRGYIYPNGHCSIVCNSQDIEAI